MRRRATPGSPRSRTAIPCAPTTTPRSSRSPASSGSTSSSSAPRRRSSPGSPTSCGIAAIGVFGPSAAAARIEGSKAFAKEVLEPAGVPTARTLPSRDRPASSRSTGSPPARESGSAGRRTSSTPACVAAQALGQPFHVEELLEGPELSLFARRRRRDRRRASRRRATTSASATVTPARTPAAWAPSRRCPTSPTRRRRRSSRRCTCRCSLSSPAAARPSTASSTRG